MKSTIGLIMALAAIGSNAQSLADLPECGQACVQNMLSQAGDLGCKANDVACLCKNVDFTYGIRDCSLQSCSDAAQAVINYGAEYCKNEGGVVITTADSADNTAAATGTDGSSKGGAAIATSTYETVVEESGSSVTKTLVSTLFSTATDASKSTSGAASTKSGATTKSDATTKSGATSGTASGTASASPTGTNDSGDEDGLAANAAAPVGLIAAAGIAAIFF